MKHLFTSLLFLIIFSIQLLSCDSQTTKSPNVILILTDDQGWGDLSISGNKDISTPNIDQLALNGVRFDRFYVSPVCSPTRAEILTGRHHVRTGVYDVSKGGERIDLDEEIIAEVFKNNGYKTAAYGKWHNGMQAPYHPNTRGFDDFYGFCSGHWGSYFNPVLEHNGELVKGEGFIIDDFTNLGLKFIEENKKNPFFLYLPLNTPHSPMQVPDKFWKKFTNSGEEFGIVLEDDVKLSEDFKSLICDVNWIPKNTNIIKLEKFTSNRPPKLLLGHPITTALGKTRQIRRMYSRHCGTGAYLISKAGAKKAINWKKPFSVPANSPDKIKGFKNIM